ncbi:MAG: UDP-N-acetylmuramate:L-alanyl-gamma-D-glutamyl-meso-diaminopimelate ligase [Thermodesulfobacteriota bacterium]
MEKRSQSSRLDELAALVPPAHVYLMGICGTGMGSLAGMFHESGFRVTGSDSNVYPPMSDFLRDLGIQVREGYHAANLQPAPDLVVVGNVIRRQNPEAVALFASEIPFCTMPEALETFFVKGRTEIVVAGTHGKTTLSSMIAWILTAQGLDPGFMIGGLPLNFQRNYRLGTGPFFVVEGDEYDTAFFEKSPKFVHYRPHIGVITSCEFDHADIYRNIGEIEEQFRAFVRLIHPEGSLVAWGDDPRVRDIAASSKAPTEYYGLNSGASWSVAEPVPLAQGIRVDVKHNGSSAAHAILPLIGTHNVLNALAAVAVAERLGIDPAKSVEALGSFAGVTRRQQILGEEAGITVMEDFAHHPSAVRETLRGVRARFPEHRLVAVFEPRTNTSRRSFFQAEYVFPFLTADVIVLRDPPGVEHIPVPDRFSSTRLAQDLRDQGKQARSFDDTDQVLAFLVETLRAGDLVVVMSNGSFDGLNGRLMESLKRRPR